jgi:hypothetical protein
MSALKPGRSQTKPVTRPAGVPSISKDNNEEGTGFVKVFPEIIIRPFTKPGPRKPGGQKAWKKQDPNRYTRED